eukprot:TRINITY_DN23859_c0_g1_i1.p1 TRINITY_DN23859_c0_g1~~TRINITY_DN23859_c0_g1_i1.p1  ORF type:complete len:255 (+),score=76.01 TRINITY_DN23859_c0_g1_i1:2-766(+)
MLSTSATVEAKEALAGRDLGEVVLYQYDSCPFCNKVKAYLDYHSVPYRVVEVNPMGKKELKWSQYKKVPVLVMDGEQINDSNVIIAALDKKLHPEKANAGGPAGDDEEARWRKWVDEHLVHLLSPNIYRTPAEALEAFDYITTSGNFTAWERTSAKYFGASAMYFIGKKLKKKYGIDDERKALFKAGDDWTDALGDRAFLGGDKPNLADLAVFGVLRPIIPMRAGRELLENSRIAAWYRRMEAEVGAPGRIVEA